MNTLELIRETDALTYLNALKVTQTEIKREVSDIEEMTEHLQGSCERLKKLVRKSDNQYRLIAKIVSRETLASTSAVVDDDLETLELERLMENE